MRNARTRVLAGLAVLAVIGAACASKSTSSAQGTGGATGVCASVDTSGTDALAKVCASGKLQIATDPKYPPQSSFNVQTQTWQGFDVDVATEIAQRLGVEPVLQAQKWDVITAGSWNSRWDVSVGSMTDTIDREKLFYFTPAYYYTPASMAVANDNTTINGPADLNGKTVCVGVSTTYQDYVEGTLKLGAGAPPFTFQVPAPPATNLNTYTTDTDALDNLALGDGVRCDAAISAQQTIQAYIDNGGKIKIVGDPLYYEPLSVAFDRNDPRDSQSLSQAVSKIIDDMHADGTLSSLSKKWYKGVDWTVTSASKGSTSASPSA